MEAEAIPRYERALTLGLPPEETAKAWTWLASSYSKTARHEDALRAADEAAALDGYEPKAEFDKIVASVRRRSRRR